jgi:hypothetical protein
MSGDDADWIARGRELADGDIPDPAWVTRGMEIVAEHGPTSPER